MSMISTVRRGFATCAVASVLVFAVPITSEALVARIPLGQFVMGAVRAAAPAAATATVAGPEGALIVDTVVALGALAYVTRDTWMPWVSGWLGSSTALNVQSDPPSSNFGMYFTLSNPVIVTGPNGTMSITATKTAHTGHSDDWFTEYITYQCKNTDGTYASGAPSWTQPQTSMTNIGDTKTWMIPCTNGASPSFIKSSRGSYPTFNQVEWGTQYDPQTEGTYRVDASCRKTDGTLVTVSITTTAPAGRGLKVPSCDAAWAGSHAEKFTTFGANTGAPMRELSSTTLPATSALYPNCVGAGVACTYVVQYNGVACEIGQVECINWEVRRLAFPAAYACMFGAYAVALDLCAIDERVYEPAGVVLTLLNTDGDPYTYDEPVPPWAAPAPNTATDPIPAPVPGTQTTPGPTQTNNSDCWPSGSAAWNPAEWVLTPVKCALTWAFVPDAATMTNLSSTTGADMARVGIAPIAAGVASNVALVGQGDGCNGPGVTFSAVGIVKEMHPFAACTGTMSTLAGISRAFSTLAIIGIGGFSALRAIGAGFGFDVSMGRGKGGEA